MPLLRSVFARSPFAMSSLRGKRCFITGAASGIGRATALAAAGEGAELFLTDVRAESLESVVSSIRLSGGIVSAERALDISDYAAVRAFSEDLQRDFGRMDVLMNIAGISVWGKVEDMTHAHWKKCVDVNLMGPIHVIECFVPEMIRGGMGGYIVNVSSAAGLFGLPWHAAYSASKFGLRGISEVLRFDLGAHGIGVSLVCPGAVATPLVGSVEILGVNRDSPAFRRMTEKFESRAISPEQAAAAILRGVHRGDYLVFTSSDIRVGHWFQRKVGYMYDRTMRRLNRSMQRMAERANAKP